MLVYNSTLAGLDMICMLDKKVNILVTSTKNKSMKSRVASNMGKKYIECEKCIVKELM
jgi:hypothetical protein